MNCATTSAASANAGVCAFLGITFGVAWIAWEVPIALGLSVTDPWFQLAALPGAFAPAFAALVVRRWITREGFADAGMKIKARNWRIFLIAWLLPVAVLAAIVLAARLLNLGTPDWSIQPALLGLSKGRPLPAGLPRYLGLIIVPQLLVTAVVVTPVLWGEEFGWRGYLQPRLFPDSPLRGAVAAGLIWGVWHYPLLLRGYVFADRPLLAILIFPISTILLSIIFGWLKARSGSIWAPSLAHASSNAVGSGLSLLWFYGTASPLLVGYLGVLAWIPLGIACLWIGLKDELATKSKP